MTDKLTPEQRRRCMSSIRSTDTKPEIIVRKFLFSEGFRYRLHTKKLPGSPDIVLAKYKTVIFINGCFGMVIKDVKKLNYPKHEPIGGKRKSTQILKEIIIIICNLKH